MPLGRKKEEDIAERIDKELREHAKILRHEFDKVGSDLRERFQLENASDKIKGLQNIKNVKLGVLRNQYHNEVDIILRELKDEVRKVVTEQEKEERIRGNSERHGTSSNPGSRTRRRRGEEDDVEKNDASQDSRQNASKSAVATTGKRTRVDNDADEAQNGKNLTVVGFAAGSKAGSAERPETKNSKVAKGGGVLVVQNIETIDSQPTERATIIRIGSRKIRVKGPTRPASASGTHDSAELGLSRQGLEIVPEDVDGENDEEPIANTAEDDSVIFVDSTSEEGNTWTRQKRKSKAKKKTSHSTSSEAFEVDPSDALTEKIENDIAVRRKKKSKKKESKSNTSSEVIEVQPKKVNNNEDPSADGTKKMSKTAKENKSISTDVVEIVPNAVLIDNSEVTENGKNKTWKKAAKKGGETISTTVADIQPNEVRNGSNEDAASDARRKKSKTTTTTTKETNKSTCTEVDEIQPNEDQVKEKDDATSDDKKKTEAKEESSEADSVAGPPRAGRKKKTPTPEEQSTTEPEQRTSEQMIRVRRSVRARKPTQKFLENGASKRGSRRK